jgi:hypothetical protein
VWNGGLVVDMAVVLMYGRCWWSFDGGGGAIVVYDMANVWVGTGVEQTGEEWGARKGV